MTKFSLQEFYDSGMLYRSNSDYFWPKGLALFITVKEVRPDGTYVIDEDAGIGLLSTEPAEVISGPDPVKDATSDAWIAERLANIIK